jgi:hypothetical protein
MSIDGEYIEKHNLRAKVVLVSKEDISPGKSLNLFELEEEHIYILKLDEEAIESFKEIQAVLMPLFL